TTALGYIPALPLVCPSLQLHSSPKAIPSQICMRIWQQSRKPAAPMNTSSTWRKTRTFWLLCGSCGNGKWCTSSGSAKQTGKIVVKFQRRGKPTNSALLESHYQSEHLQD